MCGIDLEVESETEDQSRHSGNSHWQALLLSVGSPDWHQAAATFLGIFCKVLYLLGHMCI